MQQLGGQLRLSGGGMGPSVIIGFDLAAALAMAGATGVPAAAAAEFLPIIEAVMVREMRKESESDG